MTPYSAQKTRVRALTNDDTDLSAYRGYPGCCHGDTGHCPAAGHAGSDL